MNGRYFVMMRNQKNTCVLPLLRYDEQCQEDFVADFGTVKLAREAAEQSPYAAAFGYEIFKIGSGI